jgi:hypothetical protein
LASLRIVPHGIDQLHLQIKPGVHVAIDLHAPSGAPAVLPSSSASGLQGPGDRSALVPPTRDAQQKTDKKPKIGLPPIVVPQMADFDTERAGIHAKVSLYVARPDANPAELQSLFQGKTLKAGEHHQLVVPVTSDQPIDLETWVNMAALLPAQMDILLHVKKAHEQ